MLYARLSAKHIVTFILIFIPGSKHWHHLPCYTDEERGDRELKSPAWGHNSYRWRSQRAAGVSQYKASAVDLRQVGRQCLWPRAGRGREVSSLT